MLNNCDTNQKLYSALGFAMKAGKLRSGELAVEKAIKSKKALLAVIDRSASENSLKRWSELCANYGVELIAAEGLGKAIGREARVIACIVDNGFAQMVLRAYKDIES